MLSIEVCMGVNMLLPPLDVFGVALTFYEDLVRETDIADEFLLTVRLVPCVNFWYH